MNDLRVNLELRATDKGLVGQVRVSERELRKLNTGVRDTGRVAKAATRETGKFTSHIHRMVAAAALFDVFRRNASLVIGFGQAMSDLSAITGAVGEDLQFYRQQAIALGSETTKTASEVVAAFKLVGSARPELLANREALVAVTKEVILLAEASGLDIPTATRAAVTSLNQFGEASDQAGRFVNVLAAGAKFGAAEIPNVALALKQSGASAANANVSFEETNALIQLLAKGGIQGAEAGTALRQILIRLSTSGNREITPAVVGISTALQNLQAQFNSIEDPVALAIAQKELFGDEAVNAALSVLRFSNEINPLVDKLTGTSTALEQARARTDNLRGDLDRLSSAWEGLTLSITENDGVVRASVQNLTRLLQVMGNNSEQIVKVIGLVAQLAISYAGLKIIQRVSTWMQTYTAAVGTASVATRGLTRALGPLAAAFLVGELIAEYLGHLDTAADKERELAASRKKQADDAIQDLAKFYQALYGSPEAVQKQITEIEATTTALEKRNAVLLKTPGFDAKLIRNKNIKEAVNEAREELIKNNEQIEKSKMDIEALGLAYGKLSRIATAAEESKVRAAETASKEVIKASESAANSILREYARIGDVGVDTYQRQINAVNRWYETHTTALHNGSENYNELIAKADQYKAAILQQVEVEREAAAERERIAQAEQEATREREKAKQLETILQGVDSAFTVGQSGAVPESQEERLAERKDNELNLLTDENTSKEEQLKELLANQLISEEDYHKQRGDLRARYNAAERNIIQKHAQDEAQLAAQRQIQILSGVAGTLGQLSQLASNAGAESFNLYKAFALGQAVISGYLAINKALSEGGPYAGPILASIAAAQTGIQIAKISQQQPPAREFGGPVSSGKPYIVGERGSELFIPQSAGQIVSNRTLNQQTNVASSNVRVSVNVVNNADVDVQAQDDGEGNIDIIINKIDDALSEKISRGNSPTGRAIGTTFGLSRAGNY